MEKSLLIAVDFDGTIVEDAFPKVGKKKPFAIETIRMLQDDGHRIILWTYRHGKPLQEAIEFLQKSGIKLYAVNKSYPEEENNPKGVSRKINADLFIDDRNFGGFPGWGVIYQNLSKDNKEPEKHKLRWLQKFFN